MSVFGWCSAGQHDKCKRKYRRSYTDPRSGKNVWLDEWRYCQCLKRGCDCYVKPADREKPVKKARRKK